ncbi:hypothetical protein IID04_07385 [PVC group bacterium]|nr:hypothetical protein [PVC group bacterium]
MKDIPESKIDRKQFLKEAFSFRGLKYMTEAPTPAKDVFKRCVAQLDLSRCLAWSGTDCRACYIACPLRDTALKMKDFEPEIDPFYCDGCALCKTACWTVNDMKAITIKEVLNPSKEGDDQT